MIAIGGSFGIIYEDLIYLKCIEIISSKLLENQRKLGFNDFETIRSLFDLTGLLLPTETQRDDLGTLCDEFLLNYNPNFTPDISNEEFFCYYRKTRYNKLDFDLFEEKCYEFIKFCLQLN